MTSETFTFECPGCGQHVSATTADSGAKVPCPSCSTHLIVPSVNVAPAPAPKTPEQLSRSRELQKMDPVQLFDVAYRNIPPFQGWDDDAKQEIERRGFSPGIVSALESHTKLKAAAETQVRAATTQYAGVMLLSLLWVGLSGHWDSVPLLKDLKTEPFHMSLLFGWPVLLFGRNGFIYALRLLSAMGMSSVLLIAVTQLPAQSAILTRTGIILLLTASALASFVALIIVLRAFCSRIRFPGQ